VNVRLPDEHFTHILNDADDRALFFDPEFLNQVEANRGDMESVEQFVVLDDEVPATDLDPIIAYEDLIASHPTAYEWPEIEEDEHCTMCYTSGTTGQPKGVLYSHRAMYLHSMVTGHVDANAIGERDDILLLVPMFHTNGWGIPYAATFTGSKLVFPGSNHDPGTIVDIIQSEELNFAAGAVTLWNDVANYLRENENENLGTLERIIAGAGKVPKALYPFYRDQHDVAVFTGWGMTETIAAGTFSKLTSQTRDLPKEDQFEHLSKAGLPSPGLKAQIRKNDGQFVERDGETAGELEVRAPWVAESYHNRPEANAESFTEDGFLKTGDVATWDEYGYIDIIDRTKNVINSGGEWISSLDLENELTAHEDVKEAAVIAIPHEKWQERPLAAIIPADGEYIDEDSLAAHICDRFPRWWVPDEFLFVESIPRKGTNKLDKTALRNELEELDLDVPFHKEDL
jgi:fatty-acyl-CoA synthase